MTKRILQIIPTLDRGGAEKQLCLLAEGLPRDEFDVHVCALDPQRTAGRPTGRGRHSAGADRQALEARSAGVLAAERARGPI